MAKMLTVADTNYRKGMNSLDDPKALQDGECAELVNAFPGYPLRMRPGCAGRPLLRYNDSGHAEAFQASHSPYVKPFYATIKGHEIVLFWMADGYTMQYGLTYGLNYADVNSKVCHSVFGHRVNGQECKFDYVRIGDIIYIRSSESYYDSLDKNKTYKMYALEWDGDKLTYRVVPDGGFDQSPTFATNGDSIFYSPLGGIFNSSLMFGYSATYVRRLDTAAKSDVYVPGLIESPEVPAGRGAISVTLSAGMGASVYVKPDITLTPDNPYGFTHVRIYRTLNLYGIPDITPDGATRFFVMDIPIADFYDNNGVLLPRLADLSLPQIQLFLDTVSVGALDGETNMLQADQYMFPPTDGYRMLWFKNRLFLLGAKGNVYFSEIPGGGGGEDIGFAQTEGDKYALWFKPLTYRLELDIEDNTDATGIDYYGDDLYMFKTDKTFTVIGGEPLVTPLRTVSDKIGCILPNTITRAVIFGREVLFFMSRQGPMLISEGGNIRPFTEFKVKELWPDAGYWRLGYGARCTATFWNNTLWIFFDSKIYGYLSSDENNGVFEVRIADVDGKYLIDNIFVMNNNQAATITYFYGPVSFVTFLSSNLSEDETVTIEYIINRARPDFRLLSRKIYPGPQERSISELFQLVAHCDFQENRVEDRPFHVKVTSNRFRADKDYYDNSMFQNNQKGTPIPGTAHNEYFERSDDLTWTPNTLVGYVAYLYHEDYPDNGIWANVVSNATTKITFDSVIGLQKTHVRLIAKPVLRRTISFVPQADFAGEYFQYEITKVIPSNRQFNFYSTELEAIPRPQLDIESIASLGDNANSWE